MKCTLILSAWIVAAAAYGSDPVESVLKLDNGDGSGSAVLLGGDLAVTAEHIPFGPDTVIYQPTPVRDIVSEPQKNGVDEPRLFTFRGTWPGQTVIGALPSVGDQVVGYGYPGGKWKKYEGRVSALADEFIVCNFPTQPGASGGGLFNAQGELIGIASGTNDVESVWIPATKIRYTSQSFERSSRVVVIGAVGCQFCEQLKRDIAGGQFPGYEFEWVTWDPRLQSWDKPELWNAFVQECELVHNPQVPVIWVPGTAKYTEGYQSSGGLIGWLEQVITVLVHGPPPRVPGRSVGRPSQPTPADAAMEPIPDQTPHLLAEIDQLKTELITLKSHVETFQEGGVITKIQGLAVLKEDKARIEESITEIRESVSEVRQNPTRALWSVIGGLVTGLLHGLLPSHKREV